MGYHIALSRRDSSSGITAQEWRGFIAERPELEIVGEDQYFITAIVDGDDNLALHHSSGDATVFVKNPSGPRIIEYMASIAPFFEGVVTGDEGETYASDADWGTQAEWDAQNSIQPTLRTWWKRELSGGKRVVLGLVLGLLFFIIKKVFF